MNGALRSREGVFAPGARVDVLGIAHWELDPEPTEARGGYRDAPKRLVMAAPPGGTLLVSNDHNG